jgi:hypothetical protein
MLHIQIILQTLAFLVIFPALGVKVFAGFSIIAIQIAVCYAVAVVLIVRLVKVSWFLTRQLSVTQTYLLAWLIPTTAIYALTWLVPQYIAVLSPIGALIAGLASMLINKYAG